MAEKTSATNIITMAMVELEQERLRAAIDREKVKIKSRRKHWFPWRVRVININKEG